MLLAASLINEERYRKPFNCQRNVCKHINKREALWRRSRSGDLQSALNTVRLLYQFQNLFWVKRNFELMVFFFFDKGFKLSYWRVWDIHKFKYDLYIDTRREKSRRKMKLDRVILCELFLLFKKKYIEKKIRLVCSLLTFILIISNKLFIKVNKQYYSMNKMANERKPSLGRFDH